MTRWHIDEELLDIQREDRADRIAADKKDEEPLTRESIQEIITRQDEPLDPEAES